MVISVCIGKGENRYRTPFVNQHGETVLTVFILEIMGNLSSTLQTMTVGGALNRGMKWRWIHTAFPPISSSKPEARTIVLLGVNPTSRSSSIAILMQKISSNAQIRLEKSEKYMIAMREVLSSHEPLPQIQVPDWVNELRVIPDEQSDVYHHNDQRKVLLSTRRWWQYQLGRHLCKMSWFK